ncbi:MAG: glycosyl transferase family 1 [Rhodospirillales bacterium]|nr:glycosyl transferase family 1 [Rhodospirillales bacterium]
MKLLMTTDTLGGVWHYATTLCRALRWRGFEVVLATMGADLTPTQQGTLAKIEGLIVEQSAYRLEWMQDAQADVVASGDWLLSLATRHDVDLVHLNGYVHAALPFNKPALVVAHSDVVSWFHWVRRRPVPAEWNDYRFGVEQGLEGASAIVTPTKAVRDDLARSFGVQAEHCRVIENGIDLADYGAGDKEPVVLFAGRLWDEAKNVAQMARIADSVMWPIEVVGDCRHPDGGTYSARGLRFLGFLDPAAMAARFASAAIFAAPARYEPFGLAIAEAAASGCVLVLSDIPSLREVWGDTALYVTVDDDAAWIAVLNRLIASYATRMRLGAAARDRARRYSATRMVDQYAALYSELCRQPGYADA